MQSEWSNFLFVPDDFIDCTANIDKYVNYELGEERREHNSNNNILWQTIFMNAIKGCQLKNVPTGRVTAVYISERSRAGIQNS